MTITGGPGTLHVSVSGTLNPGASVQQLLAPTDIGASLLVLHSVTISAALVNTGAIVVTALQVVHFHLPAGSQSLLAAWPVTLGIGSVTSTRDSFAPPSTEYVPEGLQLPLGNVVGVLIPTDLAAATAVQVTILYTGI